MTTSRVRWLQHTFSQFTLGWQAPAGLLILLFLSNLPCKPLHPFRRSFLTSIHNFQQLTQKPTKTLLKKPPKTTHRSN
jgi:hypothetical protein